MAYDWLPDIYPFTACNNDWARYCDQLYAFFHADFIHSKPIFETLSVNTKRHPEYNDKAATFWHIISEGSNEEERVPDFRRCERIRWPRPVIENSQAVKVWENDRKGQKNICIWAEEEEYVVILRKREGYFLFWTAYLVTHEHMKRKLAKEYQDFQAIQNANAATHQGA